MFDVANSAYFAEKLDAAAERMRRAYDASAKTKFGDEKLFEEFCVADGEVRKLSMKYETYLDELKNADFSAAAAAAKHGSAAEKSRYRTLALCMEISDMRSNMRRFVDSLNVCANVRLARSAVKRSRALRRAVDDALFEVFGSNSTNRAEALQELTRAWSALESAAETMAVMAEYCVEARAEMAMIGRFSKETALTFALCDDVGGLG